MRDALVILHYLAFALGIGGGVASLMIGAAQATAEPPVKLAMGPVRRRLAFSAGGAVAVLWLTGLWLVYGWRGGLAAQAPLFWIKMVFVATLTGFVAVLLTRILRALKGGTPPPLPLLNTLVTGATASAALAVLFGVLSFHG
ncbi:hypothetical protein VK792_17070 [Mesobacterium sp. TK19101]|uniref:Uncharacterized protein n=1 Tax=Mesobacterium hydrothermale TaxID=3111907 RepID=A0ABU6HKL9_9RHOB|nr:hypothetical protein [Mesobacterium sp. TK19101]MEC3863008.1 hypothetical protein [Mesobacterium sp. TK19101]